MGDALDQLAIGTNGKQWTPEKKQTFQNVLSKVPADILDVVVKQFLRDGWTMARPMQPADVLKACKAVWQQNHKPESTGPSKFTCSRCGFVYEADTHGMLECARIFEKVNFEETHHRGLVNVTDSVESKQNYHFWKASQK